ncbi:MAG: hypothetical protein AMXMBFR56_18780 [Polyangiaceae bacterium]
MRALGLLALVVGCGGGDDGGGGAASSYGGHDLGSLSESCEGIAGLTGDALLAQKTDQVAATLGYVTASGDKVSPSALTLDLTWPAAPVATCFPAHNEAAVTAEPRVGIRGVGMRFVTADGKFDETLDATAWLTSTSGAPSFPLVVGVTTRSALKGSWEPFPDYGAAGSTLAFVNRLTGATSAQSGGNINMTAATLDELRAGVFRSGFAMALWPVANP